MSWGHQGTTLGDFREPYDIAVGGDGDVYVSDASRHEVLVFTAQGKPLMQWAGSVGGGGVFVDVKGLLVDTAGNIYVEDVGRNRIIKLTHAGHYLGEWRGPSGQGSQITAHSEIALDHQNNLYVSIGPRVLRLTR
jgi:DNA-binding beta-propeller fold protein YncE